MVTQFSNRIYSKQDVVPVIAITYESEMQRNNLERKSYILILYPIIKRQNKIK